jgi:hypothetical protein
LRDSADDHHTLDIIDGVDDEGRADTRRDVSGAVADRD